MNQYLLGVLGIAAIILIAVVFSSNRKAISWRVTGAAFLLGWKVLPGRTFVLPEAAGRGC